MKESNEKRIRFNIVDALIIVFIVASLALCVYIFVLGNDFADLYSEKEIVSYTVCITGEDKSIEQKISVNDSVFHNQKLSKTGTVTNVQVVENGSENGVDLYVTISVEARKINSKYYIGGKKIEKDSYIDVSFSKFDMSEPVKCIAIESN